MSQRRALRYLTGELIGHGPIQTSLIYPLLQPHEQNGEFCFSISALEPSMLKIISVATVYIALGSIQSHAQPTPYLDGIFVDQKLYRTCMASRRNEGFCNCMFEVSSKNIRGAKFKEIWFAYQAGSDTAEAQRLRNQLTSAESQQLNGQLQAADNAQDACNARFGVR